jgi:hypothetical protein
MGTFSKCPRFSVIERLKQKQKLTKSQDLRIQENKKVSEFELGNDAEILRNGRISFRNLEFFRGFEILALQQYMRGCLPTTVDKHQNGK